MDIFMRLFLAKFREKRSKYLSPFAKLLLKLKISGNIMTSLSLLFGLIAIYFLFQNYTYFIIFALLHLLADSLDGVIARLTRSTKFGKYFDQISDSLITLLALVKVAWYLQDYYAYIVSGLFFIAMLIHFSSKLTAPVLYLRTITLGVLIVATNSLFPYQKGLLIIGYLTGGIASAYSLAKQLQWVIKK